MLLVVYSSVCAIFITTLSLVAELSRLELVNFTKSLLSRALLLHFASSAQKFTHEVVHMQFSCPSVCPSVCPLTQYSPELPLLNHSPFCDQNLLYDNALVGGMIMFSDSSSFGKGSPYKPILESLICSAITDDKINFFFRIIGKYGIVIHT